MNKQEIEAVAMQTYPEPLLGPQTRLAFLSGALWMQQNQSGMRWVRASERLPEKISLTTMVRYISTKTVVFDFEDFVRHQPHHLKHIEWLDESASSEVERLRKENEEMLAILKGIAKDGFLYSTDINSLIQKIEANGNCK